MERIEVTVTLQDKRVTIEGPEDFVRAEVQRLTNLIAAANSNPSPAAATQGATSERKFVSLKKPVGHPEMVAVLGFYLTEAGHAEFTPEDVRRAYIRAGVRPPKVIDQALRDAKNVRDFLEPVGRGKYKLSQHGDRYVRFDLP